MNNLSYLLKILNGPHIGSQVGLTEGDTLTIGNSEKSDILLHDPHIIENHCKIEIMQNHPIIHPQTGKVFIQGELIEQATKLEDYQVVTIGSTSFALGPINTTWPNIKIPEIAVIGNDKSSAEQLNHETDHVTLDTPISEAKDITDSKGSFFSTERIVYGLLIIAFVLFISSFFFKETPQKTIVVKKDIEKEQEPSNPEYTECQRKDELRNSVSDNLHKIQNRIIKSLPNIVTYIVTNQFQYPELLIFVQNQKVADQVRVLIGPLNVGTFTNIVNIDEVNQLINSFIYIRNKNITCKLLKNGNIEWNGYVMNKSIFEPINSALRNDLSFLRKDENRIFFGNQIADRMNQLIEKFGFKNSIDIQVRDSGIDIIGEIEKDKFSIWEQVKAQIMSEYSNKFPLTTNIREKNDLLFVEQALPAPITGVIFGGDSPWIQLANGMHIFPGTTLNNGSIISSITDSEIIVTTQHHTIHLSIDVLLKRKNQVPSS